MVSGTLFFVGLAAYFFFIYGRNKVHEVGITEGKGTTEGNGTIEGKGTTLVVP